MIDSLKVHQNDDGSFALEWDKKDPKWNFLNNLTSKEITAIIEEAIKNDTFDDF
jgi:hypothetical protein|tara:strand:- start:2900 stop:3061 length:162 start_codon:yes stop_codon:yes gene_type:complete